MTTKKKIVPFFLCMVDQLCIFVLFVKILIRPFQMTNTIQKKFKVSSTQLLYQTCPYQSATLLFFGPYLDKLLTNLNVFAFKYTTQVTVRFKMICVLIFKPKFLCFVNLFSAAIFYTTDGHYSFMHDLYRGEF